MAPVVKGEPVFGINGAIGTAVSQTTGILEDANRELAT